MNGSTKKDTQQRRSFPVSTASSNAHVNLCDNLSAKDKIDKDINNEKELQHRETITKKNVLKVRKNE